MIVSGPHGVEVGSTGGVFATKDFIFCQTEAAQDALMTRGDWVIWDSDDNLAVTGINQNTRGLRIKHTTTAADLFISGCLESSFAALTAGTEAANRVLPPLLVQVYGHHNFAKVIHTAATGAPLLLCTSTTAGAARPAVTATNADIIARCGNTMATTINGTTNIDCFVTCMG